MLLYIMLAGMVELADTLDLGSNGQPCRFKSCYPHKHKERARPSLYVYMNTGSKNLPAVGGIINPGKE